jgi:glycine/D-amino acid oxidase-like deaminating enzyme
MPSDKNILIIGSGIGGLSTAILLAKLGFEVTVRMHRVSSCVTLSGPGIRS